MDKLKDILVWRQKFIRDLRDYFYENGFIEIDTPLLVSNPGLEPHLEYFESEFIPSMSSGSVKTLFLATSPEYHLKKALATGLDKIFEITPSFRNGEISKTHEPEFLMLEWYRHPGSYMDIAQDCSELFTYLADRHAKDPSQWKSIESIDVCEAFQEICKIDLESILKNGDEALLSKIAFEKGHRDLDLKWDFDTAFNALIASKIEPAFSNKNLVLLKDYPASQAALSRKIKGREYLCERFEIYFQGIELANAFGELTDSVEQRSRCLEDMTKRKELHPHRNVPELDESFLGALDQIDQAGGIALGLERLMMCLKGVKSLNEVRAFSSF